MNQTFMTRFIWYAVRLLAALLVAGMAFGLAFTIVSLPPASPELALAVADNMAKSGVSHPVTAVLLNFRGYDTLLEMAVLLLALIGTWSLAPIQEMPPVAPAAVLDSLTRLLTPLIILTVGYLLWAGAHAPGGAFQAGALLAALGVLLNLTGWHLPVDPMRYYLRGIMAAGLIAFLLAAANGWIHGMHFFSYPHGQAHMLILFIETFATLSIGITLVTLFLLGRTAPR
ncbi:Na(+)/H(+) antiporter subunit B [Nitrosomonas sp. ANs5]|uniref:Na(+)/H(+) antiporter subunit B n=1 Tax=Nitrosomonas sp. ANs5 TaxID=3423941 RepID=UPI003D345401